MAYVPGAMRQLCSSIEGAPPNIWAYTTGDSLTAIETPNYVSDAELRGLQVGDTVLVLSGVTTYLMQLSALSLGEGTLVQLGAASVSAASAIEFVIDGGGGVITPGVKGYLEVPWAATIAAVRILAVPTGSVVLDIWKCSFAQYDGGVTHPVASDSITASDTPAITNGVSMADTALTGWTIALNKGDILAFDVRSVSAFTRLTVSLDVTKS